MGEFFARCIRLYAMSHRMSTYVPIDLYTHSVQLETPSFLEAKTSRTGCHVPSPSACSRRPTRTNTKHHMCMFCKP